MNANHVLQTAKTAVYTLDARKSVQNHAYHAESHAHINANI